MEIKFGTAPWFETKRRQCVDHLRAYLSIDTARQYADFISKNWQAGNELLIGGLHSAAVVAYCRPFTENKTKAGRRYYPDKKIRKCDGFDPDLHSHILELRHKLIAHADYGVLQSTMFMHMIGDERRPVDFGINVAMLHGIKNRELVERYQSHFNACVRHIVATQNLEMKELAKGIEQYPHVFSNVMNEEVVIPLVESNPSVWSKLENPPNKYGTVETPEFSAEFQGYSYRRQTQ